MTKEFATYSRFFTIEDAAYLVSVLDKAGIPYTTEEERDQLDKIYLGEPVDPMIVLKLPADQFEKVNALLAAQAKNDFETPGFTHYFDTYEMPELEEIINNPDDWNAYDLQIARLLLIQNNITMPEPSSEPGFAAGFKPEKIDTKSLVLGYALSLFLVGIFFGMSITQAKKTLHNGQTVRLYDAASISHGHRMILIGLMSTGIWLSRYL